MSIPYIKKYVILPTKNLTDKLLLEKIPFAGIARVTEVSEPWLQSYVNAKHETVPKRVEIKEKIIT
jgi:hypothetical protein